MKQSGKGRFLGVNDLFGITCSFKGVSTKLRPSTNLELLGIYTFLNAFSVDDSCISELVSL